MRLLLLPLLAALVGPAAQAQSSAFAADLAKAPADGSTWHFIKSNRDGSKPWQFVMHVVSPTQIEVVKSDGREAYVEVQALVDLQLAMPVRMQQWNIECGERRPTMTAVAKPGAQGGSEFAVHLAKGPKLSLQAGPAAHFWGFDLTGFALLAPHLRAPGEAFELSFIDPNQPGEGGQPVKVAAGRFTPGAEEIINGQTARRYALGGPLFGDQQGAIWLAKGELVKAEHALRTSNDWSDWKLERVKSERLDRNGWERFKLDLQRRTAQAQADDPDCKKP
jgi:hypothetical protein